ncbi:MAG TPA: succinylglutamate desuccinylase/aspartoacylase family protein [Longimicrobiales bacterium]|nr:succinylglutamate desuccinylase/aspartoacylase family protein [Longimicrobiales bacterium]
MTRSRGGEALRIHDVEVAPGERGLVRMPVSRLTTGEFLSLAAEVVRGRTEGPALWLSGAIHGDELDGVEIVRRVLRRLDPDALAGTVIGVPVVNLFGFVSGSRYLPDRRDLNRSFPGRERGSMAAQLAHLFTTEIVQRCDYGIDFHCGSSDRRNLPQVRADLDDAEVRSAALAFGAPLVIHSRPPDGSLRKAASEAGARVLVYEGGEAHRFDPEAIRVGVDGVFRVLAHLGMADAPAEDEAEAPDPAESRKTRWVRAVRSGICRLDVGLGERVSKGQRVGEISDTFGHDPHPVKARHAGVVIGVRIHPLVYKGEAVAHLAEV